ncbi:MAG: hypothetical protein KDD48_07405 [Bdellovibrionales bacterium]|nr:hypothetical protein [Bdellovibrionales bacterium]
MTSDQYVWLLWSLSLLIPWIGFFSFFPRHRKAMLWASLYTTPFGITEPLFVPKYWNPPSLFHLAQRTGFDIESFIFCFAIGGVGAVAYNILTHKTPNPVSNTERQHPLHRHHHKALAAPFITFALLVWFPWNAIYPGILSMLIGALATALCRPDLKWKVFIGGGIFLVFYMIFLLGLDWLAPGYIARVWNMNVLTGITLFKMPIEELLFAIGFGMYWSGVYEHFTWRRVHKMDRLSEDVLSLHEMKGESS